MERLGPLPAGFERGQAGVALDRDSVWLSHGDEMTELDPITGAVRRTIRAGGRWHREIATNGRLVWVGFNDAARPEGAIPKAGVDLARPLRDEAVGGLGVIRYTDSVWQLDPTSGLLQRTLPVGGLPEGLVFVDDVLWVTSPIDGTLRRVDARSGETDLVVPLGHPPEEVAAADGRLWVAVRGP